MKWQPTPVFLPGDPTDRGAWWPTVHGVAKQSDMTWRLNTSMFYHKILNIVLCVILDIVAYPSYIYALINKFFIIFQYEVFSNFPYYLSLTHSYVNYDFQVFLKA